MPERQRLFPIEYGGQMSIGDKLIVAGVVTVPAVLTISLAIYALRTGESDWFGLSFFGSATVAAGLITTGILIRKNRS
jgi:hypothetical protein